MATNATRIPFNTIHYSPRQRPADESTPLLVGEAAESDWMNVEPGVMEDVVEAQVEVVKEKRKLGTFDGVFTPTCLNTLSILMFLRFGYILGQCGILGMFGMLVASYAVNLLTTLSVSAVSSNGTVRGGGAYYLISRTLGPEFGGSIGLVFYLGQVLNTGMNAVGLVNCIITNYGAVSGTAAQVLPESFGWNYLYSSIVLIVCTVMSFFGSGLFAKASNGLLLVLMISTLSIPASAIFMKPFTNPAEHVLFTGLSWRTFSNNLWPSFSPDPDGKTEDWASLFGILFPATAGIFAGASMSGDLRKPSKSIPKGTLYSLVFTFSTYALVIFFMGASVSRVTLHRDLDVIQDTNFSPYLILMGELSTSFFSTLMGLVGAAKCLQALARDGLYPGFTPFAQGTSRNDEPIVALILTFVLSQITLLAPLNLIASFITMTFLMTFFATNLACTALKLSSAPNFRPSFRYFSWHTALAGVLASGVTMFLVDGASASGCVLVLIALFLLVHYTSPPKSWGDVSQSLIYHQVRKYLLRLRSSHIKFWRPQILLLVNDPRRSRKLVTFCNSMKKGGLYILGHVIVTQDFESSFDELKKQQEAWVRLVDWERIKAFVHVSVAPTLEWGARNAVISAGLGGMRPNIVVVGMFNLDEYREEGGEYMTLAKVKSMSGEGRGEGGGNPLAGEAEMPTDGCRSEKAVTVTSYVNVLEDLLLSLQMNVAVARGFTELELPTEKVHTKKYIDLWPIQMTSELSPHILTTNFDTYTLILQLGAILNTVPSWRKTYTLRVCVFVEYESDVADEHDRVSRLLSSLRIQAQLHVFYLAKGDLGCYQWIIHGEEAEPEERERVESVLAEEAWWREMREHREGLSENLDLKKTLSRSEGTWAGSTFHQGPAFPPRDLGLRKILGDARARKRKSFSGLSHFAGRLGVSLRHHAGFDSASDASESETDDEGPFSEGAVRVRRRSMGDALDWPRSATTTAVGSLGGTGRPVLQHAAESDPLVSPMNLEGHPEYVRYPRPPPPPRREASPKPQPKLETQKKEVEENEGLKVPKRPEPKSRKSAPMFTSKAMPDTAEEPEETAGPSIRFVDSPKPLRSATKAPVHTPGPAPPAVSTPPVELAPSFNDLPSLGQHLIINELIRRNSKETAVVFTTLPAMPRGTWREESECVEYLRGLEVLTEGVGPVLMVHSNTLVVTTAL
ncbi:hypothetical protein BJ508DRAFT_172299 [Ascobolus immersus RN42]|uniref:Amino acid permease/ SLC12A domain-containing protein n=1 Tax=Ascobolus immersus RN42 TaxID=1160509 RepID=A0A3N4HZG7_ASCIM|nr:hypothetical protein BJ508DRAFT_172299 [Ascobolus immersus RN42]